MQEGFWLRIKENLNQNYRNQCCYMGSWALKDKILFQEVSHINTNNSDGSRRLFLKWTNLFSLLNIKPKWILVLITFTLYFLNLCDCLTPYPIQQRTTLRAYDANTMLNFDTFGIPVTKYSNPLHSNIDYTYFMSQMQPGLYQYKKFSHSTMSATVLISSILISNYNVMDIWNNGDTLDYIVATNTITNNVEIVTLIASGST